MKSVSKSNRVFGFFAVLIGTAFVSNWLWEMIQMPAYARIDTKTWMEAAPICTLATLKDAAISLLLYCVGALVAGRLLWPPKYPRTAYVFLAGSGMLVAAIIEWRALAAGRWAYNATMPIVPLLHVGLWPLLQLTLLIPAAAWIAVQWFNRSRTQ